jgi:hypothetical protein
MSEEERIEQLAEHLYLNATWQEPWEMAATGLQARYRRNARMVHACFIRGDGKVEDFTRPLYRDPATTTKGEW